MSGIFGYKIIDLDIDRIKAEFQNCQSNTFNTNIQNNVTFCQCRPFFDNFNDNVCIPMEFDGNMLAFNGEIYNYKELRQEYLKEVEIFFDSDAEVLLHLLRIFGMKILNKLNGIFSFAYYDTKSKSIFLVNDRYGSKELYYYINGESLVFSSSDAILTKILNIPFEFNQSYIDTLFVENFIDFKKKLINSNLEIVNPGEYIEITVNNKVIKNKYYNFNDFNVKDLKLNYKNKKEIINYFENLLTDSIKLRCNSKFPIALTLSGGTDSSVIYTLIKERLGLDVSVFTYSNADKNIDEFNRVKKLTEKYNDKITKIEYSKDTFEENYKRAVVALNASMCISDAGYYSVYRKISEQDYKTVIEGHGSDEIFGGYSHCFLQGIAQSIFEKKFLTAFHIMNLYKLHQNRPLMNVEKEQIKKYVSYLKNKDKHLYLKYLYYLIIFRLPKVLIYWNRVLNSNSLDIRCPFLDYRVVEFALALPIEYKLNRIGNKAILREILKKYNIDFIYNNKIKQGFTTSDEEVIKNNKDFLLKYYDKNRFHYDISKFDDHIYKACSVGFLENYYKQNTH